MHAEKTDLPSRRRWQWAATIPVALVITKLFWPVHTVPAIDFAAACPGERWIGVLNERHPASRGKAETGAAIEQREEKARECPKPWRPLFESAHGPVPPGLQRFCLFEGEDPRERLAVVDKEGRVYFGLHPYESDDRRPFERVDREAFAKRRRDYFERIDRDCPVVGPAAGTFFPPPSLSTALKERFRKEVGTAPAGLRSENVRIEIIDSVQDSKQPETERCPSQARAGDLECSPHGWALASLAKDLLGDAVEIRSRRALTRTYRIQPANSTPERVKLEIAGTSRSGGLYGTWSELGAAIWRALDSGAATDARQRLVLNLSLGWESIYGTDIAAVRAPIEVAVCRGALVVAAAGNRRAGPPALEKPLLPAAWEQMPAPSEDRCRALLGAEPAESYASKTAYRPLLYAVSGVQRNGRLLATAKPAATPRFVAFGDHASTLLPRDSQEAPDRLVTLTGTSVSTLVVAAAAAVRWQDDADQSAFDVMETLWNPDGSSQGGGEANIEVEQTVDFCLSPQKNCPPGTYARRISVGPPAPAGGSAGLPTSPAPTLPPELPIDATLIAPDLVQVLDAPSFMSVPGCDPQLLAYQDGTPATENLCPQRWLVDIAAQPWLGPQPGSNHNPDCRYTESSPGTLVLEFEPCFRIQGMPVELDHLTLVAGAVAHRLPIDKFTLGDPTLACPREDDARRVQVVLKGFSFEGLHPMYLAATVNGTYATITPILQVLKSDEEESAFR